MSRHGSRAWTGTVLSMAALAFLSVCLLKTHVSFVSDLNINDNKIASSEELALGDNLPEYDTNQLTLLTALKTNLAGNWMKEYTKANQLAGTNPAMAHWTLNQFSELGLVDTVIDEYTSLISYPLESSLKLYDAKGKLIYEPSLVEDELEEDENSKNKVPAFLGYGANGNVTANYIFANYGTVDDFQLLVDQGVDIKGKIVIMRYGKIYRGLKVKFAQDHGAIGALLFTDTIDDGPIVVENGYEAYPNGPARNPSSIQRGSSMFLSYTPGDPTTPGYAIKPGDKKTKRQDPHHVIPYIPALPISFKEVQPILATLSGHGPKFDDWKGRVADFDYSVGPNVNATLNLYSNQDFNVTTIRNVMGTIKGKDQSKYILIGNHYDSWTPAAADPHSGSAALLEVIRAFSKLSEIGWVPKYSIKFASWDGEEYGLLGSTEFGEYYSNELKKHCVAYINTDVASIGEIFEIQASPLLNEVLKSTAEQLEYPGNPNQTLWDHLVDVTENGGTGDGGSNGHGDTGRDGEYIGTLGSGSDFTVFLQHLGIPSVSLGFKNNATRTPIYHYHSIYDSVHWIENFADEGYVYHNSLAKYISFLALALSDNSVLALRTVNYSKALFSYFNELKISDEWRNISTVWANSP